MYGTKRLFTGVAALATSGMLVLATPGLAQAASFERGDADRDRVARDADGDAEARATATGQGRLSIHGEAEGRTTGDLLTPEPVTVARSVASLSKSAPVADGTYRVAITYKGAAGRSFDRGGADARSQLRSTVRFGDRTLRRTNELGGNRQKRTVTFAISIPENASGRLRLNAALRGSAVAPEGVDRGRYSGSVRDVRFTVNRIGN